MRSLREHGVCEGVTEWDVLEVDSTHANKVIVGSIERQRSIHAACQGDGYFNNSGINDERWGKQGATCGYGRHEGTQAQSELSAGVTGKPSDPRSKNPCREES